MQSTSVYGTAVGSKAPTIFHLNQTIMGKNTAATKSRKFKRYFSSCFRYYIDCFNRNGKRRERTQTYEEMASVLKLKIDISDEDLEAQFKDFQNCYPEGKINEDEFLEIFSNNIVFSPNSLFR